MKKQLAIAALTCIILSLTPFFGAYAAVGEAVLSGVTVTGMYYDRALGLLMTGDNGTLYIRDHMDVRIVLEGLDKPAGAAVGADGAIYISDSGSNAILRVYTDGTIDNFSGGMQAGYAEGTGGGARFDRPGGIAIGADGTIYVADTYNHCIRAIDTYGRASLFAGMPGERGQTDGPLRSAAFNEPSGLAMGEDGTLYVADRANNTIRVIHDGSVTTLPGCAGLSLPEDIAIYDDALFIADSGNDAVRLHDGASMRTIMGGGEYTGAAIYTNASRLYKPIAAEVFNDSLYIADSHGVTRYSINEALLNGRPREADMRALIENAPREREAAIYINGERLTRFAPKVLLNGDDNIMIPGRDVSEALGLKYVWDDKNNAIVVYGDTSFLHIPSYAFSVVDGKALIPLDSLAEAFDLQYAWFPDRMALLIYRF